MQDSANEFLYKSKIKSDKVGGWHIEDKHSYQ